MTPKHGLREIDVLVRQLDAAQPEGESLARELGSLQWMIQKTEHFFRQIAPQADDDPDVMAALEEIRAHLSQALVSLLENGGSPRDSRERIQGAMRHAYEAARAAEDAVFAAERAGFALEPAAPEPPHLPLTPGLVIAPGVRAGRPVVAGTRVTSEECVWSFLAGDSVETISRAYNIPREGIEASLQYELGA